LLVKDVDTVEMESGKWGKFFDGYFGNFADKFIGAECEDVLLPGDEDGGLGGKGVIRRK
jgi:hypothetical protein